MTISKTKNNVESIKKSTLAFIVTLVISTVAITYAVINSVIVEHYKLEIQRLEKIIDQSKSLEDLNGITISLKNILLKQNNIIDSLKKNSKNELYPNHKSTQIKPINQKINESILLANTIKVMDPSDKNTLDKYYLWRNQTISLLKTIDIELKSNYVKDFTNLTDLPLSSYVLLRSKISDGILILESIKNIQ